MVHKKRNPDPYGGFVTETRSDGETVTEVRTRIPKKYPKRIVSKLDEVVCSYCEALPCDSLDGWKEEEFGWRCPDPACPGAGVVAAGSGGSTDDAKDLGAVVATTLMSDEQREVLREYGEPVVEAAIEKAKR